MSGAVQREDEAPEVQTYLATGTDAPLPVSTRQLAAERLAAHRNRRSALTQTDQPDTSAEIHAAQLAAQNAVRLQTRRDALREAARHAAGQDTRPAAASVREAVAARYQESVSYREFLAAAAQRELEKAQAEAEVATRNALALATAQRELLDEIAQWNEPVSALQQERRGELAHAIADVAVAATELLTATEPTAPLLAIVEALAPAPAQLVAAPAAPKARSAAPTPATSSLRVQLYADLSQSSNTPTSPGMVDYIAQTSPVELAELDQEIAFRLSPHFAEREFHPHIDAQPIQANIIEFPRQLVASRKARPRLAEGPLLEDGTPEPQLRIFEVEPELISVEAAYADTEVPPSAAQWQSLLLPAVKPNTPAAQGLASAWAAEATAPAPNIHIYAAPIELRLMAAAVDAACILTSLVAFATVAAYIAGPTLSTLRTQPRPLLIGAAIVPLTVFFVLYKLLFFTLNDATPGMRYARIAFCTFQEESPTRRAIRRRLFGTVLAACPVGLGLLWIALDSDRLGWHDRLSHMYPRHY